ncbi:MAG: TlpA family protein disulfide reductase [Bacteroidaceae bacterium]|nr:TlpA family protein disulfide reductase [Bacteroidaceae bacterium]
MRYVKWIFAVLLVVSLTAFVDNNINHEGLEKGDVAPDFKINTTSNGERTLNLTGLKGHLVLISFWASYDATSRMNNVKLSNALCGKNVEMVSVSFDSYPSIFKETVRTDRIKTSDCFLEPGGENSRLYKDYRLKRGFTNFLLDKNGVIIAKNITTHELSSIVKKLV